MSSTSLFEPIKVGSLQLKHRVVLSPMTRFRCDDDHVPTALVAEYYGQRASRGGLLIAESTGISPTAGLYPHVPGCFTKQQIEGWKKTTAAVHKKGGFIFLQLVHQGRSSSSSFIPGNALPVSASAIAIRGPFLFTGKDYETPRALTIDEIAIIVQEYAQAASNAIEAGFDGVEVHGANGYLIDQFLNTASNKRTDEYGGSIENRARFALKIVDAISKAISTERVGIRFSPFSTFQDVEDGSPYETWGYIISELQKHHPNLAYIHMLEPRNDFNPSGQPNTTDSLDHFREKWNGPFISSGGYTTNPQLASKIADTTGNLIAIGRAFIANPDLPHRLKHGLPLTKYDRNTFYTPGPVGYTDYPFYKDTKE